VCVTVFICENISKLTSVDKWEVGIILARVTWHTVDLNF
jgi:hypothetical protein